MLLYLVFKYNNYYPSGAMHDHLGTFRTKEEAVSCAKENCRQDDDNERLHIGRPMSFGNVDVVELNVETLEHTIVETF